MFQFNPLSLIPDSLKTVVRDAAVDFVSDQAKKILGEELGTKIKKLRSDAGFNQKFEKGLQQAINRFVDEYSNEDEDLVAAIEADATVLKNEQVQKSLLEMLRNPGKYMGEEHATVAETFATVLPGRRNRDRVDKAMIFLLRCLTEELWNLPELQPIYSLQFQRMTAEATRQQVDLQKVQLQALTTVNEGVRQALLQLTDAIGERKLLLGGENVAEAQPKVLHNLANPTYNKFIGRDGEIETIMTKLRPYPHSQVHLITIDGIGGIGKSTVALEVAHRCLQNSRKANSTEGFDAIIWTSAKKTILTPEGIKARHQILQTLDDVYTTIAVTLGKESLTRSKPEEQAEIIRSALSSIRCLLIIDNLETVDDEKVISFLMELPAPTKAIVTTRHRIDLAYPMRLLDMPKEDAEKLVKSECEERNINLDKDQIGRLVNKTGGVPLAVVWSIAQIGAGYEFEPMIERLSGNKNELVRFCFERVLEQLRTKPAREILLTLSIFATGASREALGFVAGVSEWDRDDGLVLLEKLSLINKKADHFSMLPLTKEYSYSILAQEQEHLISLRHKQHEYYMGRLEKISQERQSSDLVLGAERRRFRELEIENILSHVDWCLDAGEIDDVPYIVRGMSGHMWAVGRWALAHKYGLIALKIAQESPARNLDMEAYFLFRIGRIDLMRGDNGDAEARLLKAMELYNELNNISRLAHVASYLGILYINQKRYEESKKVQVEILERVRRAEDKKAISRLQNVIGQAYLGMGKYDLAEAAVQEAHSLRNKAEPSTGLAASYELLGRIKLLQDQPTDAADYFNKCYEISRQSNVTWYMAFAKKWLAETSIKLSYFEDAKANLNECIKIFKDTGMKEHQAEAEILLAEVDLHLTS